MLFKNTQALFSVLFSVALSTMAMEKPAEVNRQVNPKRAYLTRFTRLGLPTSINGLMHVVQVQTDVEVAPLNTEEEKIAFVIAREQAINKKENEIVDAYCKAKKSAIRIPTLKALLNIHPTALYINPEQNKLVLRQEWCKCTLSDNHRVYLETRLECAYDPETASLTPGSVMLYIFTQDKPQRYVCVSMARLRAMFPKPDSLKITPLNQEQKMEESCNVARANLDAFLAHRQVHESPDPHVLYNKLYFEDLKVMAEHFLAIQDIPTVD